jgi:hypothetical protein
MIYIQRRLFWTNLAAAHGREPLPSPIVDPVVALAFTLTIASAWHSAIGTGPARRGFIPVNLPSGPQGFGPAPSVDVHLGARLGQQQTFPGSQ